MAHPTKPINNDKIIIEPDNKRYNDAVEMIKEMEEDEKDFYEIVLFLFALLSGFLFNLVANFLEDFVKSFGDSAYTIFRIIVSSVAVIVIALLVFAIWRFLQLKNDIYSDLLSMSKKRKTLRMRKSYKINELVKSYKWEYKVTNIKESKILIMDKAPIQKVSAIGKFVLVYLTYKNIGKENFEIRRADFDLVDIFGSKYQSEDVTYDLNIFYKLTAFNKHIPPNVECNSVLCFDISPEAKVSELMFEQANESVIKLS